MAKFRGIIESEKNSVSRLGHRFVQTEAQSWQGKVVTRIWEDKNGRVVAQVDLEPHEGSGISRNIYSGLVGDEND